MERGPNGRSKLPRQPIRKEKPSFATQAPALRTGVGHLPRSENARGKLGRAGDVRCTTVLPPKADVHPRSCYVAFVPKAAVSNRSKAAPYSITSSARASSVSGTVRPSALAVLRLITRSYLVGAC